MTFAGPAAHPIGPEELVCYAGHCLDIVLDMHNVIPPLSGPTVTPDGQDCYRVSYETNTLTVQALFHGSVREGRLTLQQVRTPHWKGEPNSVDVFGGYDSIVEGKPQHLRSETSSKTPATVQAP